LLLLVMLLSFCCACLFTLPMCLRGALQGINFYLTLALCCCCCYCFCVFVAAGVVTVVGQCSNDLSTLLSYPFLFY
jgi:hypothetical protein